MVSCERPPGSSSADGRETYERPVDRFRRGAVGGVVAAALLGLRDALEGRPERDDVAIVAEVPGPGHGAALDIELDPDHPETSLVVIRSPRSTGHGTG